MIRNLHPEGIILNRAEMDRRETAAITAQRDVLMALYATTGVAHGLIVAPSGTDVTVAAGAAIVSAGAAMDLAVVREPQVVDLPDVEGVYGIYLRHDALVRLEPYVQDNVTLYRREASYAYAANGLAANEGVIVTPGLVYAAQGATVPDGWVLLAQATRAAGVVTVSDFTPTPAALRAAVESGDGGGGLITVGLDDLEPDLKSIINRALLMDGSRQMTGSLNLGGYNLNAVTGITTPSGDPLNANVTRLGGKTLPEVLALAGAGDGSGTTPVPVQKVYSVTHTQVLGSGSYLAPRNITATIPNGAMDPEKFYSTFYSGEGSLLSRAGQALTLRPDVRLGTVIVAAWQGGTGTVTVGRLIGVSGVSGAYYASTVIRTSDTEVRHVLQKVIPGDVPTVSAFDNVTLTAEATAQTPPPYELTVSGNTLVWGGRNTGIGVTPGGDASNPDVATESDWVRGYLRREVTSSGVSFQRGTQVVNGSVLLIQSDAAPAALAVG